MRSAVRGSGWNAEPVPYGSVLAAYVDLIDAMSVVVVTNDLLYRFWRCDHRSALHPAPLLLRWATEGEVTSRPNHGWDLHPRFRAAALTCQPWRCPNLLDDRSQSATHLALQIRYAVLLPTSPSRQARAVGSTVV